jgi:prefoldin subunit 2
MVERTVGEVVPALKNNRESMVAAIKNLEESAKQQNDELQAFIKKHNIRIIRDGEENQPPSRLANIEEGEEDEEEAKPKTPAGVLV